MTDLKDQSFKERYAQMVSKSATLNWVPSGVMTMGGKPITYISLTQMKANLAPIFSEFGLLFWVSQDAEPMGSPTAPSGWKVTLKFTIEDVYSDEYKEAEFTGVGTGDKALIIANSFALKTFLNTVLLVADGSEPIDDSTIGPEKAYVPKTPAETQAAVAKIKETAKASTVSKAPAKPAEAPKAVAKPAEPADEETAPAAAPAPNGDVSEQRKANVASLMKSIQEKHQAGEITDDEMNKVVNDGAQIKTNADANRFIIKYRKLAR